MALRAGDHRLYRWDPRLEGLAVPAVVYLEGGAAELRIGKRGKCVLSVCPPSVGADGRRREWHGTWDIGPIPEALVAELGRLAAARHRCVPRSLSALKRGTHRYGAAALGREAGLVRGAGPGTRNRTLNRAAFCLGQLVGAGLLGRGEVEAELLDAALAAGLPGREALGTIRSGLEAGLLEPRSRGFEGG